MEKHSLSIAGHRTSISLEAPFWAAFRDIAKARNISVSALVQQIDAERMAGLERADNLSSAIRVFVLRDLQRRVEAMPSNP